LFEIAENNKWVLPSNLALLLANLRIYGSWLRVPVVSDPKWSHWLSLVIN